VTALPVLVAGAGPVGLTAAAELARRGVAVRCIERAETPSTRSRALLVWPRTLEVFDALGGAEDAARCGRPVESFRYYSAGREVLRLGFTPRTRPVVLPQPDVEALLRRRLAAYGGQVEHGTELVGFTQRGDRVDASLRRAAAGTTSTEAFSYLLGCDGASSVARDRLGLDFGGATYANTFVLADARLDGQLEPESLHYFCSPRGVLVVIGLPSGRFRFFTSCPPGMSDQDVTLDVVQRLVDHRGPGRLRLHDPDWVSTFLIHRRKVDRYRVGRVFLAGDAAHVHSPAGGQGLNTGVTDAHNLAWKIAFVLQGSGPAAVLDSYEPERVGIAAAVLRQSDLQTRAWLLRSAPAIRARDTMLRAAGASGALDRWYVPSLAGLRGRYPPDALLPGARRRSGRRWPGRRFGVTVGALVPDTRVAAQGRELGSLRSVLPADAFTLLVCTPPGRPVPAPLARLAAWAGETRGAGLRVLALSGVPGRRVLAVLVRPDHYVAACATARRARRLRESVSALVLPAGQQPQPGRTPARDRQPLAGGPPPASHNGQVSETLAVIR
jgi:2-polyprenyl-6-methoxyphenol hydroxylase-like FAD-dependent oxidoreductase